MINLIDYCRRLLYHDYLTTCITLTIVHTIVCMLPSIYAPTQLCKDFPTSPVAIEYYRWLLLSILILAPMALDLILDYFKCMASIVERNQWFSRIMLMLGITGPNMLLFVLLRNNASTLQLCKVESAILPAQVILIIASLYCTMFRHQIFVEKGNVMVHLSIEKRAIAFLLHAIIARVLVASRYLIDNNSSLVIAVCGIANATTLIHFFYLTVRFMVVLIRDNPHLNFTSHHAFSDFSHLLVALVFLICGMGLESIHVAIKSHGQNNVYDQYRSLYRLYMMVGFSICVTVIPSRAYMLSAEIEKQKLQTRLNLIRYVSHEMRSPLNTAFLGLQFTISELCVLNKECSTIQSNPLSQPIQSTQQSQQQQQHHQQQHRRPSTPLITPISHTTIATTSKAGGGGGGGGLERVRSFVSNIGGDRNSFRRNDSFGSMHSAAATVRAPNAAFSRLSSRAHLKGGGAASNDISRTTSADEDSSAFLGINIGSCSNNLNSRINELLETVAQIADSCNIALFTLDDLLTFDKLDEKKLEVELQPLNPWQFTKETCKPFHINAKECRIHFTQSCSNYSSYWHRQHVLRADKFKLSQVVRNLVSNALKFTPEGGQVRVIVDKISNYETSGITSSGQLLRLSVTDTGPGISKQNLHKLFGQYVQFNPGKLQQGKGSGLGLWISKSIVELHGGSIYASSDGEGMGCTFILELPLYEADYNTFLKSNSTDRGSNNNNNNNNGGTITLLPHILSDSSLCADDSDEDDDDSDDSDEEVDDRDGATAHSASLYSSRREKSRLGALLFGFLRLFYYCICCCFCDVNSSRNAVHPHQQRFLSQAVFFHSANNRNETHETFNNNDNNEHNNNEIATGNDNTAVDHSSSSSSYSSNKKGDNCGGNTSISSSQDDISCMYNNNASSSSTNAVVSKLSPTIIDKIILGATGIFSLNSNILQPINTAAATATSTVPINTTTTTILVKSNVYPKNTSYDDNEAETTINTNYTKNINNEHYNDTMRNSITLFDINDVRCTPHTQKIYANSSLLSSSAAAVAMTEQISINDDDDDDNNECIVDKVVHNKSQLPPSNYKYSMNKRILPINESQELLSSHDAASNSQDQYKPGIATAGKTNSNYPLNYEPQQQQQLFCMSDIIDLEAANHSNMNNFDFCDVNSNSATSIIESEKKVLIMDAAVIATTTNAAAVTSASVRHTLPNPKQTIPKYVAGKGATNASGVSRPRLNSEASVGLSQASSSSAGLHFLAVDDTALNRKMISRVLRSCGHTVEEAADGIECLQKLHCHIPPNYDSNINAVSVNLQQQQPPSSSSLVTSYDVILMDENMPMMSGPVAAETLRQAGYKGVIIGLTGDCYQDQIDRFVTMGANAVLTKPLQLDKLEKLLEKLISL